MIQRLVITALVLIFVIGYAAIKHFKDPQPLASGYIKLDAVGEPMPSWAGPWACVRDQTSGLLWEVKTDDETIHDGYWTYSWWQDGVGIENFGDCYFEADRCDTADLIRRTNTVGLCGHSDWRLPTSGELASLITAPTQPGGPQINTAFFPHTKHGDYWTVDHNRPLMGVYAHLKEGAVVVDFSKGTTKPLPYRNAAFVRLVSDGPRSARAP